MSETLVVLSGGLDLQSPNVAAAKGTLRDCLNVEVGTQGGYVQIDGHMPHDGTIMGPDIEDFVYVEVPILFWNTIPFQYGEVIELDLSSPDFSGSQIVSVNCIGWSDPFGPINGVLLMAFVPGTFGDSLNISGCMINTANAALSGASASFLPPSQLHKVSDGLLSPQNYDAYRTLIESRHVAAIDPVPGELTSCIDAAFTYKDVDYAIHDCIAFYFKAGQLGQTAEGHQIRNGTTVLGTILSVTVTSGSWAASTAAGYVVVYDQADGATFPADGTSLNLWTAGGLANIGTWAQYDGVTDRTLLRSLTRALLYSANSQQYGGAKVAAPWVRRRLSRELGYSQIGAVNSLGFGPQGDSDYSIYEYSRLGLNDQNAQLEPVTTAYKFCITPAQNATAWTNLANIQAQDGLVATCLIPGGYSTIMTAKGFDFSEIPQGSVITGLEVVIRRRATTSPTSTRDNIVRLVMPEGTFSTNKADLAARYPIVLTDATYGGATDSWGIQLTRDLLNNANFGIQFESLGTAGDTTLVDDIKVRATYVPATRLVYIRNATASAPTDIEARVVHYTRDSGDATVSDQVGTLTLWIGAAEYQGTAAGKSRTIGKGEEIRTASGGGGSLLALTTGEDTPTSLPCGAAVDAKLAKWVVKLANYYADPDAQMCFAVNGTEYAFMYDEQYSVRIRTGRRQDLDTPRHIAHHLNFVHFGFDSGDVITSAVFRPLTVDPAMGSQLRNVGEPITGLDTMNGQTLGVWTNRAVRGFQGNSPLNYIPIVISPAIGAIEYTVTNLAGVPMWTSARGVESAATVSAYGDFTTDPLSYLASPWLQDRVQFDSRVGLVDKRPVMAIAVRSKRQYRLYFRDGYVFTVTLFGVEDIPMCTIQRLERGDAVAPYNQAPIRHAFAGVRDDGRESLLMCFERQNPIITDNETNDGAYPYVSQLDAGRSFAGKSVPAYIELNPIYGSIPTQEHKWQSLWTWANAQPLTRVTVYTKQAEDTPFNPTGPAIDVGIQPDATITYLPFPNYSFGVDLGRSGPFLRIRYNLGIEGQVSEPARFTHLVLTSEGMNVKRT